MGILRGRGPRLDRRAAERLLSGWPAGTGQSEGAERPDDTDWPELTRLLRAASGAASPDELAGEQAARAGFNRERRLGGTASVPQRPRARTGRAVLAVQMAVALVAVACVGLGTGAATGSLPTALQQQAHRLLGPLGVPAPAATASGAGRSGRATPSAGGVTPAAGGAGALPVGPSSLQLAGWCRAYLESKGSSPGGKGLGELASAAGGVARIPAFCAGMLDATGSRRPDTPPATHPSHPAKPARTSGPPRSKADR